METKLKLSLMRKGNKSNTNKMWIYNDIRAVMINKNEPIPVGFVKGRGKVTWSTI